MHAHFIDRCPNHPHLLPRDLSYTRAALLLSEVLPLCLLAVVLILLYVITTFTTPSWARRRSVYATSSVENASPFHPRLARNTLTKKLTCVQSVLFCIRIKASLRKVKNVLQQWTYTKHASPSHHAAKATSDLPNVRRHT